MSNGSLTCLGVHLTPGVAWVALVDSTDALIDGRDDRLAVPSGELSEGRALSEFLKSFEALIRVVGPDQIALLDVGRTRFKPKVADSQRRGQAEAILLVAAHRGASEGVTRISHDQVEGVFESRPSDDGFPKIAASRLPGDPPPRWTDRAKAYAAAVAALKDVR